jgi:membrane-associated protein
VTRFERAAGIVEEADWTSMIEFLHQAKDFVLHFDDHLRQIVGEYGAWVYALLFLIIFCETGLVVTPFLPGDSLLFATGALAASGDLNIAALFFLLWVAAVLGDAANYAIGNFIGPRIFTAEDRTSFWQRLLNRQHLMKAHAFYEKYGGKAVVLGRFVPIARTFVPFVAGCGSMSYPQFALYNVVGGLLWVSICLGAGYGFGNIPVVKENFELVVVGIVFISLLPIVWGVLIARMERRRAEAAAKAE